MVAAYKAHKKKVDEQETAIKEFLRRSGHQLSEILAAKTARYLKAAANLDDPKADAKAVAAKEGSTRKRSSAG